MPVQKTQSSLFILDNRKFTTFYLKDNNGKLWVVSSDYCFFSGCSYLVTIDPVLTESNNDLILVETPILHFAGLKFSSCLRELTNLIAITCVGKFWILHTPQKSLPKKILAKFSYPPPPKKKKKKNLESKISNPKNPSIIPVTWNLKYPTWGWALLCFLYMKSIRELATFIHPVSDPNLFLCNSLLQCWDPSQRVLTILLIAKYT